MGACAQSVTEFSDPIYQLVKIEPDSHAPPVCEFIWNAKFPGTDISPKMGNQKRNSFKCIVESVRHQYTLFSPEGVPLRATVSVNLREYKTLDEQLLQLNLNSPDRTQVHVLQSGETLSSIAGRHYRRSGEWRLIADANDIDDPRRLTPGTFLTVPPIR
jgi:nucleoid-associated protein YgaU